MIGKKLREYRGKLRLTGTTLAKLAGINQPYLSEIENEKKVPPFDTFMNLVNAISKNALITEENKDFIFSDKITTNLKEPFVMKLMEKILTFMPITQIK